MYQYLKKHDYKNMIKASILYILKILRKFYDIQ